MSDTFTADAAPAAATDTAPVASDAGIPSGPADAGAGVDAATTEPVGAPAGETYEVKVNGEVQQVTLEELRNGYSRTSDYTKKTQELAQQRAELQQAAALAAAFERDPQAALAALAEAYNWNPQGQPSGTPQDQVDPYSQAEPDPYDERFQRLEGFFEQQQREQAHQRIESEFSALEAEFGEIDRQAVIAHAVRKGTDLTTAYRDMQFDEVRKNAQIVDQKRAAQVVEGAATAQKGSVSAPPKEHASLRDAIRAAVRAASN